MLSILEKSPIERPAIDRVVSIEEGRPENRTELDAGPEPQPEESGEFEIVLGRTQIASVLFIATVIVVVFSAISYLAGKSLVPKAPVPVAAAAPAPAPVIAAPAVIVKEPEPVEPQTAPERAIFADPKNGVLYMQLGAVEKGMAVIMTEGLRKRSLDAFVAPGPNDHIFRVLIGPLDATAYQHAKEAVDALGLSAFARKYQQ